jgi:hydrogenase nickel incorporation protein HypB
MANLITIEQKILKKNADIALENRREIERRGLYAVGLVSAPGSGKTALLEKTLAALAGRVRCAVIEGDVQTDRDAQRVAAMGVPVVQIVTNGTCHLEARMVQEALPSLPEKDVDLLFVENVGNLVCPSSYDLGEHDRAVLMSVTEGEDKPLKYPSMFRNAHVLVITKTDLLPHLEYDVAAARRFALQVNPSLRVFEVSCRTGAGMDPWNAFLEEQVTSRRRVRS